MHYVNFLRGLLRGKSAYLIILSAVFAPIHCNTLCERVNSTGGKNARLLVVILQINAAKYPLVCRSVWCLKIMTNKGVFR